MGHGAHGEIRKGARASAALVITAALLAAPAARAQTKEELDRARVSFQEGVALSAANNCAAALAKFQSVVKVKRTPQVLFNIGECEERLGKLVSALGNFRLATAAAEGDRKAKDVTDTVGARIADLEQRIPKLVIRRAEGARTAAILLDGVELGAAEISGEIPVDPGPHTVVARIGDREMWRDTVTLEERSSKTVDVTIEAPPSPPPAPPPAAAPPPEPPKPAAKPSKVPGIVVLSAGIVSGVVGGIFLGLRGGTISDLDKLCGGDTTCPSSAKPTADKGKVYTGVAEVTLGLSAVGLVAGAVMLVTAGKAGEAPAPTVSLAGKRDRSAFAIRSVALVPGAAGADVGGVSAALRF